MGKIWLFALLVLPAGLMAQAPADSVEFNSFDLNVEMGLTFSKLGSSQSVLSLLPADFLLSDGVRTYTGVYAGLTASEEFGDRVGFQAGIAYSRLGAFHDDNNARLLAQNVDAGAKLYARLSGFNVGLHGQYSYLISSTYRFNPGDGRGDQVTDVDGYENSIHVGPMAELEMQPGTFLSASYWYPISGLDQGHFRLGLRVNLDRKQVNHRKEIRKFEKAEAIRHINTMKDGVLLVRLNTLQNSIKALNEKGLNDEAKELEDAIRVQNLAVMNAFQNKFSFCPVYFYYSYDVAKVKAAQYEGVLFNGAGEKIIEHNLDSLPCYIAEFGQLEPDTTSSFLGYDWVSNGDFSGERVERYTYPSFFNFAALKVKGPDFYQLRDPFPYYVKTYGTFLFNRSPFEIIARFNERLFIYYEDHKASP